MAIKHKIYDDTRHYFCENDYANIRRLQNGIFSFQVHSRIEPHTRRSDFARALSFEIYDPLWMLTRQWQYGRFNGNDCGSAVMAKILTVKKRLQYLQYKNGEPVPFQSESPLEYEVEKRNRRITPYVRIASAIRLLKKFTLCQLDDLEQVVDELRRHYPLQNFSVAEGEGLEAMKVDQNKELKRLYTAYGGRIFDGYEVLKAWQSGFLKLSVSNMEKLSDVMNSYVNWFMKKYLPVASRNCENASSMCWNHEKLGYEVGMGEADVHYRTEDYDSGKLSWCSFDGETDEKQLSLSDYLVKGEMSCTSSTNDLSSCNDKSFSQSHLLDNIVGGNLLRKDGALMHLHSEPEVKMLSYIPTTANFPGAPAHRLWEFEDRRVKFGNNNEDFSQLSNAIIMQYTSMYSHDWMITPLEVETGCIVDVKGIIVTDTFGERILIDHTPEQNDAHEPGVRFDDRWSMFATSREDAWRSSNFSACPGMLFPPTLLRNEESKPLEEVQFLRDEMANMLWGVETIIDNGCGGTWDGKNMSDAVLAVVDERNNQSAEIEAEDADYSYIIQNRVPLNWIPFLPQHIPGDARDIRFRRGKMPLYLKEQGYLPVRPSTELLEAETDQDGNIIPRFINEEEICGYGVKLVHTAQRTRWFLGESFNWTGFRTVISSYQANSGLMFDELIDKETRKAIELKRKDVK